MLSNCLCLCVEKYIVKKNHGQRHELFPPVACLRASLICVSVPLRSVLTVACEQTEVLLFDPISSRHIKTLTEAHEDCVNNIRCFSLMLKHPVKGPRE